MRCQGFHLSGFCSPVVCLCRTASQPVFCIKRKGWISEGAAEGVELWVTRALMELLATGWEKCGKPCGKGFSIGFPCFFHAVVNGGMRVIHKSTPFGLSGELRQESAGIAGGRPARAKRKQRSQPRRKGGAGRASVRLNPRDVTRG